MPPPCARDCAKPLAQHISAGNAAVGAAAAASAANAANTANATAAIVARPPAQQAARSFATAVLVDSSKRWRRRFLPNRPANDTSAPVQFASIRFCSVLFCSCRSAQQVGGIATCCSLAGDNAMLAASSPLPNALAAAANTHAQRHAHYCSRLLQRIARHCCCTRISPTVDRRQATGYKLHTAGYTRKQQQAQHLSTMYMSSTSLISAILACKQPLQLL